MEKIWVHFAIKICFFSKVDFYIFSKFDICEVMLKKVPCGANTNFLGITK